MSRTLAERVKDWKWWGEQVAHFVVAGAIVGFVELIKYWTGFEPGHWFDLATLAGAVHGGGLREIIQNFGDTDGSLGDSIVDQIAWTLGALAAAITASIVF